MYISLCMRNIFTQIRWIFNEYLFVTQFGRWIKGRVSLWEMMADSVAVQDLLSPLRHIKRPYLGAWVPQLVKELPSPWGMVLKSCDPFSPSLSPSPRRAHTFSLCINKQTNKQKTNFLNNLTTFYPTTAAFGAMCSRWPGC